MPTSTVSTRIPAKERAWKFAGWLDNTTRFLKTVAICPLCFLVFWAYGHFTSPTVPLHKANLAAADAFVASVNNDWFFNRPLIEQKIAQLDSAYKATGEGDPAKLGELRRLIAWTEAATSVADQQQYLTEVRSYGNVVEKDPFYVSMGVVVSMMFVLFVISALGYIVILVGSSLFSGKPLD